MVNTAQALEIQRHLLTSLQQNGFGRIVEDVITQVIEFEGQLDFDQNPTGTLIDFLDLVMQVISNYSNSDYKEILGKLNESISDENKVRSIVVRTGDGDNDVVDLSELPNYTEVIQEFRNVRNIIVSER